MILKVNSRRRRGTTLVECAIIFPLVFLLILGVFIGAMGIFHYLEVASLAREGARYASVRGAEYERRTGNTAATAEDVHNNAIVPRAVTLNPDQLESTVTWDQSNEPYTVTNYSRPRGNTVTVTVTYQWMPDMYVIGPITLSSSSTQPVSY